MRWDESAEAAADARRAHWRFGLASGGAGAAGGHPRFLHKHLIRHPRAGAGHHIPLPRVFESLLFRGRQTRANEAASARIAINRAGLKFTGLRIRWFPGGWMRRALHRPGGFCRSPAEHAPDSDRQRTCLSAEARRRRGEEEWRDLLPAAPRAAVRGVPSSDPAPILPPRARSTDRGRRTNAGAPVADGVETRADQHRKIPLKPRAGMELAPRPGNRPGRRRRGAHPSNLGESARGPHP